MEENIGFGFIEKPLEVDIVCKDDKYMPAYATELDACMDLKIKINKSEDEMLAVQKIDGILYEDTCSSEWIMPNTARVYETGIQIAVPKDHVMLIFPRSSTGFKMHCMLANTTGVVDAGYRDKVMVKLFNYGEFPIEVTDGQRIAQFMIIPRPKLKLNKVKDDENFRNNDRGGGIGSTGTK